MATSDDFWNLTEYERHFNNLQSRVRTIASTWMLAAFSAIAVLLRAETQKDLLLEPLALIVVVSLLASLGLLVLWILDQLVYLRLLNSVFLVGLKMEYEMETIPPIHTMMIISADERGMHRWYRLFYVVPMVAFFVGSSSATVLHGVGSYDAIAGSFGDQGGILLLMSAITVIQIGLIAWIFNKDRQIPFQQRALLFADDDFSRIVSTETPKYDDILARFNPTPPTMK